MELWVRSQDKEKLLKIDGIQYQDCKLIGNETIEANILIGFYSSYDNEILAEYKTKERALQVLDEIQRILHPTVFMSAAINTDDNNWVENGIIYQKYKDNFNIQELSTYVYQMPED